MGQFYYTSTLPNIEALELYISSVRVVVQDISDAPLAFLRDRQGGWVINEASFLADIASMTPQEIVDKYPVWGRWSASGNLIADKGFTETYAVPRETATAGTWAIPALDDEVPFTILNTFTFSKVEDTGALFPPPPPPF